MQTRVALLGIIVENSESVAALNDILHDYRDYIIGRMGIPYKTKKISVISVALDAPQNVISALSGKVGMLDGISAKTIYSKILSDGEDASDLQGKEDFYVQSEIIKG